MKPTNEELQEVAELSDKGERKKRRVPTYEERLQRVNEKQRDMLLKNLKTQSDMIVFLGFKQQGKLKSALQGLKSIISGIEASIEPELPFS